jgi:hypothetical protein
VELRAVVILSTRTRYERIYNPVALSRRSLHASIDGCQRITKTQGMITGGLSSKII